MRANLSRGGKSEMEAVTKIQQPTKTQRVPPGPRGHWLFGSGPEATRDPLTFYTRVWREYGDVVGFRALPWFKWYLVVDPAGAERIHQTNQSNYRKPKLFVRPLGLLTGNGLVTSEGEFWRRQRRLAQPAFHRQRLALLAEGMTRAAVQMLEHWEATYARTGEPFDMAEEMSGLTVRIAGETLFGADIGPDAARFGDALKVALEHVSRRMRSPFVAPLSVPTARNRAFLRARRTLDEVVEQIVRTRRRDASDRGDLLSMLMLARDEESGEGMDDRQVRDEVMTLLIAGHETTAAALTWTWYLLARNPEARRKLSAELSDALAGRAPGVEDLPRLPYTRMVFDETLRLYPPAWGQPRESVAGDEVCGYHIEAGRMVFVSQYLTHRHPDYWERPEEFLPERFAPELSNSRPRFAYYPFGGGARQCIGNRFALMEAQLIIAAVAQHFGPELLDESEPPLDATFSLRPRGGLRMRLARPR